MTRSQSENLGLKIAPLRRSFGFPTATHPFRGTLARCFVRCAKQFPTNFKFRYSVCYVCTTRKKKAGKRTEGRRYDCVMNVNVSICYFSLSNQAKRYRNTFSFDVNREESVVFHKNCTKMSATVELNLFRPFKTLNASIAIGTHWGYGAGARYSRISELRCSQCIPVRLLAFPATTFKLIF